METKTINGQTVIQPCDAYEYILKELQGGNIDEQMERTILNNLKNVEWIKPFIAKMNSQEVNHMYLYVLESIKSGSAPCDPLSWSAMYFNFTQFGINTSEMRQAINESQVLKKNIDDNLKSANIQS